MIWTENFRLTEDLRGNFAFWRNSTKNQVVSDTKYQFNLCKNALKIWRNLFEERQERRFQMKRFFTLWKVSSQGRRGIRFLNGQKLLRRLTRFKASNLTLSRALEHSSSSGNPDSTDTLASSKYSMMIVQLFKWRNGLKRIKTIEDCGNVFLFEKLKKTLELGKTYNFQVTLFEPKDQRMTLVHLDSEKKAE